MGECKFCGGKRFLKKKNSEVRVPCVCTRDNYVKAVNTEMGLEEDISKYNSITKDLYTKKETVVVTYPSLKAEKSFISSFVYHASYAMKICVVESYAKFAAKYTNNTSLDTFLSEYTQSEYLVLKIPSYGIPVVGSVPKIIMSVISERMDSNKWTCILSDGLFKVEKRFGVEFSVFFSNFQRVNLSGATVVKGGQYAV